jgi:tetratricopeptide (TPR) repeat protein
MRSGDPVANLNREDRTGPAAAGSMPEAIFSLNGEFWTIGYSGHTFPLKTSKGLTYIHRLLQQPGQECHSLDLLSGSDSGYIAESANLERFSTDSTLSIGTLGDSGEMLDGKAKQDYRRRLLELRQELEDARELGNDERASRIESEIDFLAREISRAVGLGGRDRRAGSAAERARVNISRAIKSALEKISEYDSKLGEWLDRSIRTGSFCSFEEHEPLIKWQFSGETNQSEPKPAEIAAFQFRPPPRLLQITRDRTTFVGREKERDVLRRCLDLAQAGRGSIAMVSGVPGIGKTRLAGEIGTEASEKGFLTLAGACYEGDGSVPFNPFIEILESALGQTPSEEAFRRIVGDASRELGRLVPQLRRNSGDVPASGDLSAEQSRRLLLTAFVEFLGRMANTVPVLLVIDDLQWGDEGTFSLLTQIARSVSAMPVLVIGTHRDSESDRSDGLAAMLEGCTRLHVLEQIGLPNLTEAATVEMIAAFGRQMPSTEVTNLIYTGSEGNPFFVEELLRHLVEHGKIIDSGGKLRLGLSIDALDVPGSLRLVIGRRLARLSRETRKMLDTAAVIGRSFTFDFLEAGTEMETDKLLDFLEEAEESGLISSTFEYPQARFQFSHDLIRQCVLKDLFVPRRQRLHLRMAYAIEAIDSQPLEARINDLAYHFWHAGSVAEPLKTIGYLRKAAEKARGQSAYDAALSHLRNALELVGQIPETAERAKLELELNIEFIQVVGITNSWTTTEAGMRYARARELCKTLEGQGARMYDLLQGSALFHLGRAELDVTHDYAHRMLELAESSSNAEWAIPANYFLGHASCCRGNFREAHNRLSEAVRLQNAMPGSVSASGGLVKCFCLGIDAIALWMLGYPESSNRAAEEGLRFAQAEENPYDTALALINLHIVTLFRREFIKAREVAERALRIIDEGKFEWLRTSIVWSLYVCQILGNEQTKIDQTKEALGSYLASEARLYKATNCAVLAECYGVLNQPELGLSMIDQAVSCMLETNERMTEAETWRVKGDLTLRLAAKGGRPGEHLGFREEAETCFRKAIETARGQNAKIWELRATVSLAHLLERSERKPEAQESLAEIYGWFSEGLDTPDLQQARELLESLSR